MGTFVRCTAVMLFLFALTCASAFAVDGVVLINQSAAIAGIGGCDTPGFPIVICQSGSYRLSGNIFNANNSIHTVEINADNVTLDLNGFSISGPGICERTFPGLACSNTGKFGIGILVAGEGATVKNGTISGTGDLGVSTVGSQIGGLYENLHVRFHAGAGINVTSSVVRRCRSNLNGGFGIGVSHGVIEDNTVDTNGKGVFAQESTVMTNAIEFSVGIGLEALDSIYGSNLFAHNGSGNTGGVSQKNNICDGTGC